MPVISRWKQVRVAAKIGFLDAARRLGIAKSYLSHLENGKNHASKEVLERACEVYNCQPGDLYVLEKEETAAAA